MTATYLGRFNGGTTFTADLTNLKDYKKIKKNQIYFANIQAYAYAKCQWNYEQGVTTQLLTISYSNLEGILTITGGTITGHTEENDQNKTTVTSTLYADVYVIQP